MKIRKGDNVVVKSGRDAGKTAKVLKIYPEIEKVLLEGLNMVKKHMRPKKSGEKGSIASVSTPLSASRVMLVCPKCSKPTRVGYMYHEELKLRVCKKCKQEF